MLNVATLLWDANEKSQRFSRCYDESWVLRLYAGFKRNLCGPFRFVLFTDRLRSLPAEIHQERLATAVPDYGCCIEPFRLNEPTIIVGLDTVITGSLDHLAAYVTRAERIALPRDPYMPSRSCNGVALVPAGHRDIFDRWRGENDMDWLRAQPHDLIDTLFPGQVVSFKGYAQQCGIEGVRIVYFHGNPKMHELEGVDWIERHWKGAA